MIYWILGISVVVTLIVWAANQFFCFGEDDYDDYPYEGEVR